MVAIEHEYCQVMLTFATSTIRMESYAVVLVKFTIMLF